MKHYTSDMRKWAAVHRAEGCALAASDLECAADQMDTLIDMLGECRSALKFYADEVGDGYDVTITDYGLSLDKGNIILDAGRTAQTTLAKLTQNQEPSD